MEDLNTQVEQAIEAHEAEVEQEKIDGELAQAQIRLEGLRILSEALAGR